MNQYKGRITPKRTWLLKNTCYSYYKQDLFTELCAQSAQCIQNCILSDPVKFVNALKSISIRAQEYDSTNINNLHNINMKKTVLGETLGEIRKHYFNVAPDRRLRRRL